ncbi:TVP38/TMEM64 family protein [Limosilactobacillus sp.]|uniref:TVP38/TMEM64 family protein n=1 Tax=Limosilactobacillus sp. TaxID=2773925 RepID=UPI00345EA55F
MQKQKQLSKWPIIIAAVIISLLVIYFIYRDFRPELVMLFNLNHHNRAVLAHMMRSHGLRDMALLTILVAIFNAIPGMSNSIFCVFAGLCFGPWIGLAINWIGDVLGNCCVYGLLKQVKLSQKFKHNKTLEALLNHPHQRLRLTLGFMIPVIPSVIVNYACSRHRYSAEEYLPMVGVGMLPTAFIYAFGGDALFKGNIKRIIIAVVLIIIIIAGAKVINKRRAIKKQA